MSSQYSDHAKSNMEAARISYNLLRVSSSESVTVDPVLMGIAKPVHILTSSFTVRRIINKVVVAAVEAQTNHYKSAVKVATIYSPRS